ncbi:MAG: ABC transporter substrate-binding protein [Muribaculaceae bacterium]|nr:ABC transporter substrate-binding protein [Muribaculaceae bacterium]
MKNISLFLSFLLWLSACHKQENLLDSYTSIVYKPEISSGFLISSEENSNNVLITVYNPWQGASDEISRLLIVKEGEVPKGYEESYIKGDVNKIICMSSTHIAMIDALGDIQKVNGVSGKPYITNTLIQNNSSIPDIGYEGNMDYETLLSLNPDLVLLFSVNGASSIETRLKEFGIPYIYIGDYVEESPLGKVEWIVPIAEILGKRETGINIFQDVTKKYTTLKDSVAKINPQRPTVMLNAPFLDSWFMPSTQSYVARMIHDAGAQYIYTKNSGNKSLPIDMEAAYKLVSDAEFWLNPGTFKTIEEIKSSFPKFNRVESIKNLKVYNNNKITSPGGGNDCYESGVMNPDIILRDLIKIFHPDLIEEELVYYHRLE